MMLDVSPGGGARECVTQYRSPPPSAGAVNLHDLAPFALAWLSNPYDYCADFDCSGAVALPDLALFAQHRGHMGPAPGYCQQANRSRRNPAPKPLYKSDMIG